MMERDCCSWCRQEVVENGVVTVRAARMDDCV